MSKSVSWVYSGMNIIIFLHKNAIKEITTPLLQWLEIILPFNAFNSVNDVNVHVLCAKPQFCEFHIGKSMR